MFLFSLIFFPVISSHIFNKYKNNVIELNGIVKVIGIIGLFTLILLLFFEVFNNSNTYVLIVFLWYAIVFFYNFIRAINLQLKSINKFKYDKTSYTEGFLKIFFFVFIIIFFINIVDNYSINRIVNINNNDSLLSLVFMFLYFTLLFGAIYQFFDIIKNYFFKRIINKDLENKKLKQVLKAEILKELKTVKVEV